MKHAHEGDNWLLFHGDVLAVLAELPDDFFQCITTSPPYWGLRDYSLEGNVWGGDPDCDHLWGEETRKKTHPEPDHSGNRGTGNIGTRGKQGHSRAVGLDVSQGCFCQACGAWKGCLGMEPDPALHIQHLLLIFREVRRVLRPDGTLFLNYGDCYIGSPARASYGDQGNKDQGRFGCERVKEGFLLKAGQRAMMPARVAIAMQEDGWYLRSEIVWGKPNPKPSSVAHRPTDCHEMVYLFTQDGGRFWIHPDGKGSRTKPEPDYRWIYRDTVTLPHKEMPIGAVWDSPPPGWTREDKKVKRINLWRSHPYYYDRDAARMPYSEATLKQMGTKYKGKQQKDYATAKAENPSAVKRRVIASLEKNGGAQMRTVWWIKPEPVKEAHFATFPRELVDRCFKLGTSEHGCCPHCEAPFVRLVEATGGSIGKAWHDHDSDAAEGDVKKGGMQDYSRVTKGWSPSCDCEQGRDEPIPCRVMDIFHGSGTSCIAANKLGLEYVGIEASEEYIGISVKRITYYEELEELREMVTYDGKKYVVGDPSDEPMTKSAGTQMLKEMGFKGSDLKRIFDEAKRAWVDYTVDCFVCSEPLGRGQSIVSGAGEGHTRCGPCHRMGGGK